MARILLLLHAHLPYVRHTEHPRFLEESWYFEAVAECYVPLMRMLQRLPESAPDTRIALSISPTLLGMARDPSLGRRLTQYLEDILSLSEAEIKRTRGTDYEPLAQMYAERYAESLSIIKDEFHGSIIGPLTELARAPQVELLTTCITHAFLPNFAPVEDAVRTQVRAGMKYFRESLGQSAKGLWLPECGYYEGLDRLLKEEGAGYFLLSSHGLLHARPRPRYGLHAPVRTPEGLVAFGIDRKLGLKVWSARAGYPAHPDYRDFYKDIGFDVDAPHVCEFMERVSPEARTFTGIKYHRITGSTKDKEPYLPASAQAQARADAKDFADTIEARARELNTQGLEDPLFVLAFDAELFGHWWHEGRLWLEGFLKEVSSTPGIETVLPGDLAGGTGFDTVTPGLSSWGEGGYGGSWSNPENLGLVLQETARLMSVMEEFTDTGQLASRALMQAVREALQAQASDWGFLGHKGTAREYSAARVRKHIDSAALLRSMIRQGKIDEGFLVEREDRLPFPDGSVLSEQL